MHEKQQCCGKLLFLIIDMHMSKKMRLAIKQCTRSAIRLSRICYLGIVLTAALPATHMKVFSRQGANLHREWGKCSSILCVCTG